MKKTLIETKEIEKISKKESDVKQILVNFTTKSTLKFWLIGLIFVFL